MKLKLTWLLTLCMAFMMQFSFAQEKTVTGTVTEEATGFPAAGITVLVDGTSRGTQTDFDGKYSIKVNEGEILSFSSVGLTTVKVTVGSSNVYDVSMQEDVEALDEVVVVGYGTTTKKAFAGTVTTVSAENIENKNFANVTQSLAGEASGVQVINTSGQPGTVSNVRVRGFGSITGNREPLYVVDGIPITARETLNAINPGDIKSTSILKDATATAIYGSRGANGVVLITTKSGSSSESYVEVDVRTGLNTQIIPRYEVVTSQEEYVGYVWEGLRNQQMILNGASMEDANTFASNNLFADTAGAGIPTRYNMWNAPGNELIDPTTGQFNQGITRKYTPENFQDLLIRDGVRYEANVRFGGGDEKTRYFVSAGFLDNDGYVVNSGYKRYNARVNVSSQIKDWLKVGVNMSYLYAEQRDATQLGGSSAVFEFIDKTPTLYPAFVRDENGEKVVDPLLGGFIPDYGAQSALVQPSPGRPAGDGVSPYGNMIYDFRGYDRNEFVGNANLDFKLAEGLTLETSFSYQYRGNLFNSMRNPFYGPGSGPFGTLYQENRINETINGLQLLRYKKEFGKHSFEALAAHESNEANFRIHFSNKEKVTIPFSLELSQYIIAQSPSEGYIEGRTLESFFGQLNYDFDDRFYLTASVRRDGTSVFANNKWDTFYSIGGAWVLTNESWGSNVDWLRFFKIKASYGTTGDVAGVQAVTGSYYNGINWFDQGNVNDNYSVPLRGDLQNPDITWERSTQFQTGAEFTLGDFVDGNIDYYIKDTENLFFDVPNTLSTGSPNLLLNDGVLRNTGLEFDLNFHLVRKENFTMNLGVNGAVYTNELVSLPKDFDVPDDFINFGTRGLQEGKSIYAFYMREYAGVDPADGFPMWYEYFDDLNNNGVFDDGEAIESSSLEVHKFRNPESSNFQRRVTKTYANATQVYTGDDVIPDLLGAFRLNGSISNFTYAFQFTYQVGGEAYDNNYREFFERGFATASGSLHVDIRNRWQEPGDITDVPRLANGSIPQDVGESDRFIISSDYIALNNINIGYNLPSKMLAKSGIDNVNIFFAADNVFISTARKGYNPTVREAGFTARNIYAPLSTFTLGAKLKF